jgi:two-component system NtrC family sensor kinase
MDDLPKTPSSRDATTTGDGRAEVEQLRQSCRLATVGLLAADVLHDAGSPLMVIAGRAKLLASGPEISPEVQRHAAIIERQTGEIGRLLRLLIEFAASSESGPGRTDVCGDARRVVELLGPTAKKRRVQLELGGETESVTAEIGSGPFQQVLVNLAINGIQAMPQGGRLTVHVRRDGKADECAGLAPGEYCCVEVGDEGVGIEEQVLPRIFEPFFSTRGTSGAAGLGLPVAMDIVTRNGGGLAVSSRPREGALFKVFLPLSRAETAEGTTG